MIKSAYCITVIIPNFNGKNFLEICLDSISRQTFNDSSVIVVDNGSVDGPVEFVRDKYGNVEVIEFKTNKGFGAAVNEGIKRAKSEYVCLLNNDVELGPNFLKEMVTVLEQKRDVDYCAAKMFNYYDRNLLDGAGDEVSRAGVGCRVGRLEYANGIYDKPKTVFGACAGAAVYRRSFFWKCRVFR